MEFARTIKQELSYFTLANSSSVATLVGGIAYT